MSDKKIAAIMISRPPLKTEYVVGFESLDLAGGEMNIVYEDGSYKQVPLDETMQYYVNTGIVGRATVTVSYMDFQTAFQINIRNPQPKRIDIITPPSRTDYTEGDRLDLSGLRLMEVYENGMQKEVARIPELEHTVQLGEAVVPLPIGNLFVPILIHVHPNQAISLSVQSPPVKTSYIERTERFDSAGGMLEKKLSNGKIELVPMTNDMVSGFNNMVVGKQTLTVSYGGRQCTFEIEITPRRCQAFSIKSLPLKRTYTEGTPFELYGVSAVASAGSESWDVPIKELEVKPQFAELGCIEMTICYQDKAVTIPVTILPKAIVSISVHAMPAKLGYKEGVEELSLAGGMLEVRYDNGFTEVINMDRAQPSGFDNLAVGEQTITLTYQGKTTTFVIDIIPKTLLGIHIAKMPERTEYLEGESFDGTGMVVEGLYDTGVMKKLDGYQLMPARALTVDDTAVIVSYVDKTAVVTIHVRKMEAPKAGTVVLPKAEQFYPSTLGLRFG